jgi:hypothetical protein
MGIEIDRHDGTHAESQVKQYMDQTHDATDLRAPLNDALKVAAETHDLQYARDLYKSAVKDPTVGLVLLTLGEFKITDSSGTNHEISPITGNVTVTDTKKGTVDVQNLDGKSIPLNTTDGAVAERQISEIVNNPNAHDVSILQQSLKDAFKSAQDSGDPDKAKWAEALMGASINDSKAFQNLFSGMNQFKLTDHSGNSYVIDRVKGTEKIPNPSDSTVETRDISNDKVVEKGFGIGTQKNFLVNQDPGDGSVEFMTANGNHGSYYRDYNGNWRFNDGEHSEFHIYIDGPPTVDWKTGRIKSSVGEFDVGSLVQPANDQSIPSTNSHSSASLLMKAFQYSQDKAKTAGYGGTEEFMNRLGNGAPRGSGFVGGPRGSYEDGDGVSHIG